MVTAANLSTSTGTDGNTNATSYAITAFARTANRAYLLGVLADANSTADIPTITGEGTWVRLAGGQLSQGGGEFYRLDVFGHQPSASDASTNCTIQFATTQQGCSWSVIELNGVFNDSAHNGAALFGNLVYDDTSNTLQTSNTATLGSGAVCTVVFAGQADNNGFTLEGTYTEVAEHIGTSPLRTLTAGFLNAADTSVVATVTGGGTAKIGMVAFGITDGTASFSVPLLSTPTIAPTPTFTVSERVVVPSLLLTPTTAPTPSFDTGIVAPPPPPPSVLAVTSADLLEPIPTLGVRVDRFVWELLDKDLRTIGNLSPSADDSPNINAATDRQIARTLDGLTLTFSDASFIDPIADRLRPWMVLQNGERFPLGVYLFGDHQRSVSTRSDTWQPKLYDQGLILNDKRDQTISIVPGQTVQAIMTQMLREVGITRFVLDGMPVSVGAPVAWPAGTERYRILKDLATTMGCLSPFFDNDGVFRCVQAPAPATTEAQFAYGPGRIDADSVVETDDSYQAPNRYIAIGAGKDTPIVAYYDIPPEAPHSYAHRGYLVSETIDIPGVESSDAALLAARAAYLTDTRSWQQVSFTSPLDPRHDLYAVVAYEGVQVGTYLEVGFRMTLTSGGEHSHDLSRLWGPT